MGETRVQVCGRIALTWHGERVEAQLPARQGRLLFAYLVVHRARAIRRDELIDALWGDGAPAAAEGALRALLSRLRRVLGAEALPSGDQPALVLPDDAFVDLERDLQRVAAQRVRVLELVVGGLELGERRRPVARSLVVLEDLLAVQVVHGGLAQSPKMRST